MRYLGPSRTSNCCKPCLAKLKARYSIESPPLTAFYAKSQLSMTWPYKSATWKLLFTARNQKPSRKRRRGESAVLLDQSRRSTVITCPKCVFLHILRESTLYWLPDGKVRRKLELTWIPNLSACLLVLPLRQSGRITGVIFVDV